MTHDPAPPRPGFADDFTPVDTALQHVVDTGKPRSGLRFSLLAWASDVIAWLSLVASAVCAFVTVLALLAEDTDAATACLVAAIVLYLVGVTATVAAAVCLVVSFLRRRRDGSTRRAGPVLDLVALTLATAISVAACLWPVLLVL
ncbi:hypothetical protein [Gordonia aurantiaca]|uniref:hypothetical protein n=1 Tax=Gordonia sp. B21 TaxID=3151852 RepID=UPI003262D1C4